MEALFKLSYGLFVVTAKEGEKDNGCIVNTVQQVTSEPSRISVAINKQNYTHDMVVRTGKLNVSILTERAKFSIFEQYGFQSGRTVNKFQDVPDLPRTKNGLLYITESVNAVISGSIFQMIDLGTHTLFIVDVEEAITLSKDPSVTYAYYFANIKPKPQDVSGAKGKVWICMICNYVYDEAKEGIPFEELPEDWVCPLCKHPKKDFELKI